MSIDRAEVAHLARLARLALSDDQLDHLAGQLDVILAAMARVGEAATPDVPPTSHPVPLANVVRPDRPVPPLPLADVLFGAPAVEQDRFRVPRILDEDQ